MSRANRSDNSKEKGASLPLIKSPLMGLHCTEVLFRFFCSGMR